MMIKEYIENNTKELYGLIYDLCRIPAPSHNEGKRAEYIKAWFDKNGIEDAYIDEALNVVLPYGAKDSQELTVFAAHTDTVFPDTEPMPYSDDGEYIRCPGVGDNTASLAVLMLTAKYFVEKDIKTNGVLFVANSCEEGLGDLKGVRKLFSDYEGRIAKFIAFDSFNLTRCSDRCVGSRRYEVEAITEGGHSYNAFGNKNAIAELSSIVGKIYSTELPEKEGRRVTYNVGEICGGTSVNTIAQSAKMLCEYRSDDEELLAFMKARFERIFDEAKSEKVKINVRLIGERPCAGKVDEAEMENLKKIASRALLEVTGEELKFTSSSTDCNIPLSLGIPAICIGVYNGYGAHTREESVEKSSLIKGFEIGLKAAVDFACQ